MRITVGECELEVSRGTKVSEILAFARARGVVLPDRPWCGTVGLHPEHPAGVDPLVDAARITATPGPDMRPRPGRHLAVIGGPDAGRVVTLGTSTTIGRDGSCDLAIFDATVSRLHAIVHASTIRDAGTTNGTRVGGTRVRRPRLLRTGDVLTMGATAVGVRETAEESLADIESGNTWRSHPWAPAAAVSGLTLALATGRLYLAAIALAAPVASWLAGRRRDRNTDVDEILDVCGTAPGHLELEGPVAVIGPRGLVRAVTIAHGRPPGSARHWEEWMGWLPRRAPDELVWLADGAEPPSWTRTTITAIDGRLVLRSSGSERAGVLPLVSARTAEATARRLAAAAAHSDLPTTIRWAEVSAGARTGMTVPLGHGLDGPVLLDLISDGPHMLIAGTTGAGKSAALETIVASLAWDLSPAELTLALVDFKGGAGLRACLDLPHVASTLTDLEPHLARRALLALAAELEARKRGMAAAGATTFDAWPQAPPRLLVVVDEFQEIAREYREFLPDLARLAAQGRSLGMHLILATQRPAGAVSAEIRANVSTTLVLRTASEAESHDVIGTADAAAISAATPGRAILRRAGSTEVVQVALPLKDYPPAVRMADEPPPEGLGLAAAAADRHAGHRVPGLWLAPLPVHLAPAPAMGRFSLGIADDPAGRRQFALEWEPDAGPLVVTGPPHSGRTMALRAVCAQASAAGYRPMWCPPDARLAVRTMAIAAERPDALLVIDEAARTLAAAAALDAEAPDLVAMCAARGALALVEPPSWHSHRLTSQAAIRVVMTGLSHEENAAWGVPVPLRIGAPLPGRAVAATRQGWWEVQLAPAAAWHDEPVVTPLPEAVDPNSLPTGAIGVGGDDAAPITLPPGRDCAVVGPDGDERGRIARAVARLSSGEPEVADSVFALTRRARAVVICEPTARTLRAACETAPQGLLEPAHRRGRVVIVTDGRAVAAQLVG